MKQSLPKILVLTSTFPRWQGDKEPRFVFDLCQRLSQEFSIHVLAPHAPHIARREVMGNLVITRFRYFIPRWQSLAYGGGILNRLKENPLRISLIPFFFIAQILAIRKILKSHNILAIHAHWLIPQGASAVLAKVGNTVIPLLCTSHGGDLYGLQHPVFRLIKRWIIRKCGMVTVVSQAMKEELFDIEPLVKSRVIPMGTDLTSLFCPRPNMARKSATLLFVGRLVEKKGVRYLIDAFSLVLHRHPDAVLLIVGSGPEETALRHHSKDIDILNNTHFLGAINHRKLPDLYRQATMTIVPSIITSSGDQEGLGLVIVEALGCQCPVIASDLPAIHDVIEDGKTGLLVPPGNSEQLADAINNLLENPQQRTALARTGRTNLKERFDWENITERYSRLLKALIATQHS